MAANDNKGGGEDPSQVSGPFRGPPSGVAETARPLGMRGEGGLWQVDDFLSSKRARTGFFNGSWRPLGGRSLLAPPSAVHFDTSSLPFGNLL